VAIGRTVQSSASFSRCHSDMDKFDAWVAQTTTQYRRVKLEDFPQLLAEAKAGGQAAVGELRRRFGANLEARLGRNGPSASERASEIVNDVFLHLPTSLMSYADSGRFEQWLYGLAFNRWRTIRRSILRDRLDSTEPSDMHVEQAATAPVRIDLELLRARAEQLLSEAERDAWLLHVEGFDRSEIGQMLGIAPNAVGVRLDRAKKRLREMLTSYL
jgi:RNA polymerase sigma-70 factor (ECF subfamily)